MNEHRELWWDSPTTDLGKIVHLDLPEPFATTHGGTLAAIQVSYEAWGELNAARDNAVLVVHPMTADCHVAGEFADQATGWWEPLVGPGKALDTSTHFVVCPNLLGGCYGTTGPRFTAPDGKPFLDRFPLLTPLDMMRVQRLFLHALGVTSVRMVIGPSMGAMIAWEWAIEASDFADQVVVVAAPLRTSPYQIGLNWLQRRGIELDITEDEVVAKVGQMVARGVGMMSYRSPVGLEEKFGRDWFKPPGSTLRERGMYNVESWLRHHGRRITKRFDPFTYLLYSRAMDLHDVSDGRGDLVSALTRVTCRTIVIGISSDNLYPPAEVQLGADILDHLGRDVRYEEIRSPNGHDAFLLDTDQIDAILRDQADRKTHRVSLQERRSVQSVGVGILGAGNVAASFVRLLGERWSHLVQRHGLAVELMGVAEIDRAKQLDPVFEQVEVEYEPSRFVTRQDLDVIIDLTRGQGTLDLLKEALSHHINLVTPNKELLRAYGDELEWLAFHFGVRVAFHDSIAAGWPLIHSLERPLSQKSVDGLQAVLSSACNVMLELIESGASFGEALGEAAERGLMEPDPMLDVSGWDTAQKLVLLLTQATGRRYVGQQVETIGIDRVDPLLVRSATELGLKVKLAAVAADLASAPRATVRPVAVPAESHLGMVRDVNHVVVVNDAEGSETVFLGSGGGALPVATAVLNDLIGLFDPSQSWTGKFPAEDVSVQAPEFDRSLILEGGKPVVVSGTSGGGVPVLGVGRSEA
jgi:homoserine O-acetyltransferase